MGGGGEGLICFEVVSRFLGTHPLIHCMCPQVTQDAAAIVVLGGGVGARGWWWRMNRGKGGGVVVVGVWVCKS